MLRTFSKILNRLVEGALLVGIAGSAIFVAWNLVMRRDVSSGSPSYPPPGETLFPATATQPYGYPPPEATRTIPAPTRTPGPTPTGIPLPTPATDPSGLVRYSASTTEDGNITYSHFEIQIDSQGQASGPAKPVPLPVAPDFNPSVVAYAPNGQYVLLMKPEEPGGRPYVFNQATGELAEVLSQFAAGQFFGWHPDSQHLLYWSDGGVLWLIDAKTLGTQALAADVFLQGAAVSPDGLTVAYIVDGWPQDTLWNVNTLGDNSQVIFQVGQQSRLYATSWSPDNVHLAYFGACGDSSVNGPICVFNRQTKAVNSVSIPSFAGGPIVWSPNGRYIAATGFAGGEEQCESNNLSTLEKDACETDAGRIIYVADIQTGESLQLAAGREPTWSPDGSMTAFITDRTGASEIWTIQVVTGNLQQLTTDGTPKTMPTWSKEAGK